MLTGLIVFFPAFSLRFLFALGAGGELFTQFENAAHQRSKTKVIQIVEIIEDLNARVALIDQVTQLCFERFEFQLTGGNGWILPRRDCPLRLQPGRDFTQGITKASFFDRLHNGARYD